MGGAWRRKCRGVERSRVTWSGAAWNGGEGREGKGRGGEGREV